MRTYEKNHEYYIELEEDDLLFLAATPDGIRARIEALCERVLKEAMHLRLVYDRPVWITLAKDKNKTLTRLTQMGSFIKSLAKKEPDGNKPS